MNLPDFINFHKPELERQSARHNRILSFLDKPDQQQDLKLWSFGKPGACAVCKSNFNIILADLDQDQCKQLAEITRTEDYSGVMGPDKGPEWFVKFATKQGRQFRNNEPMRILHLCNKPKYPGSSGQPQEVTQEHFDLFYDWTVSFVREAVPHDPIPSIDSVKSQLEQKLHYFWIDNDEPVSMAGVIRNFGKTTAISGVYTPPEKRGRGYAGSVVASLAETQFQAGKKVICLYTDANVPASNRCYEKIGFTLACDVSLYRVG